MDQLRCLSSPRDCAPLTLLAQSRPRTHRMRSTPWTGTSSPSRTTSLFSYSRSIVYSISAYSYSSIAGAYLYVPLLPDPSPHVIQPARQIHDSDMITGHPLEKIINGPAHHTLHHLYFTVNYGQVSAQPEPPLVQLGTDLAFSPSTLRGPIASEALIANPNRT